MKREPAQKNRSTLTSVIVSLLLVFMVAVIIVVIVSIRGYYNDRDTDGAVLSGNYLMRYAQVIDRYLLKKQQDTREMLDIAEHESQLADAQFALQDIEHSNLRVAYMYYMLDGNLYDSQGVMIPMNAQIARYNEQGVSGITGIYKHQSGETDILGICIPSHGEAPWSMTIIGIRVTDMAEVIGPQLLEMGGLPDYYSLSLVDTQGSVVGFFVPETDPGGETKMIFSINASTELGGVHFDNAFDTIRFYNKVEESTIVKEAQDNHYYATSLSINGASYYLALASASDSEGRLLVAGVYDPETLLVGQNSFIPIILVSTISLVAAIIGLALLSFHSRKAWEAQIQASLNTDPISGCPTYKAFGEGYLDNITKNRAFKYAVVYATLANYDNFHNSFGEEQATAVINYIGRVLHKSLDSSECYAHVSDGKFVFLIHFTSPESLTSRLNMIYQLITGYDKVEKVEFTVDVTMGVYLLSRSASVPADEALANAIIAERHIGVNRSLHYNIYDKRLDEERQIEREIEQRKEVALQNGEFVVYYQPKLNLQTKNIDGAEALVRWYYPEKDTIYSPGRFLPYFEMNGFIDKLDRYIYIEVLKFMQAMVEKGQKMCPISINVSRYTAMQSDFVSFYISNKKKYKIADGYIYLEFTESTAYDNHEVLRSVVDTLHANGIKCSVDDFGVGYSSYAILKELPMDEIKLDASFMRAGYSAERDESMLRSVIALGNALHMKVTQEGVENISDIDRLRDYGCNVLQGYCYSKALSAEKFEEFLAVCLGTYGKHGKA